MAESADFELNLKDKVSKPAKKAKVELTNVQKAWKRLERLQETAEPRAAIRAFNKQEKAAERAASGIDRIAEANRRLAESNRRVKAQTALANRRLKEQARIANQAMMARRADTSRVGGMVGRGAMLAGAGALAAGAVGVGIEKRIIEVGATFEQAITNVGAVGLKTRDEISELEAKARELGGSTQFTATEAANAMEIMARAGFDTQEILSGVSGVLDAAGASGLGIAEVADHVSNVLKGLGLEASETTRVADVLTVASARTNSTIGTLGESLTKVAATARQFNIPLEDAVASVALLQDVGHDASTAGTAMDRMLTKIAKPTDDVRRKMDKFGITFQNAHGDMLTLPEVLANMGKAAEESSGNMEMVAFFADLVGLRGQKAAVNLKDMSKSGRFEALAEGLRNAAGKAKEMRELRLDTLIGDWTLFKSAVDELFVALFDTQTPLRDIVQSATDFVKLHKPAIVETMDDFMSLIRDNGPMVSDAIDGWGLVLGGTVKGFLSLGRVALGASIAVGLVGAKMGQVLDFLDSRIPHFRFIGGAFIDALVDGMLNSMGPLGTAIRGISDAMGALMDLVGKGKSAPEGDGVDKLDEISGKQVASNGGAVDAIMGAQVGANDNSVQGVSAERTAQRLLAFEPGDRGGDTYNRVEAPISIRVEGNAADPQVQRDIARQVEEGVRKALAS